MPASQACNIEIVPQSQYRELLMQLEQDAPEHGVTQLLRAATDDATEFWAACRQTQRKAIAAVQWHSGNTVSLTGPWAVDGSSALALIDALLQKSRSRGISLVQSLTELDVGQTAEALALASFRHIADLLYLVSLKSSFPDAAPRSPLSFTPCTVPDDRRLLSVVQRTYRGTLDCPSLNGVRSIEEVVQGYQSTSIFSPQLWSIATLGANDIGCSLLAEHPAHGNLELVYIGVAPEYRGRGFGLEMVRRAQWIAKSRKLERVVLAVDAANYPALQMYAAAGFVGWDRRSVWVHLLDRGA
jgi:mycothiol synthase